MSLVVLWKIAFATLTALDYLRGEQKMHRDIRPSNILLNRRGEVKLCDFALATQGSENRQLARATRKPGHMLYRAVGRGVDVKF